MKTYRVDLHGMTVIESKIELNHILDSISWDYTDVLSFTATTVTY